MFKKNSFLLFAIFTVYMLALPGFKAKAAVSASDFADPLLYTMIMQQADLDGDGQVTDQELEDARYFSFSDSAVKSLAGIEKLPHLEALAINGSKVTDLSPLAGCNELTSLIASDTAITDFSVLADKTKLYSLYIENCRVSDLSFLKNLTNMEYLNLRNMGLTSMDFLAGMAHLKDLYLDGNKLTEISVLANLSELENLFLNGNPIGDYSVLAKCSKLKMLTLADDKLTDVSFLNSLKSLQYLSLYAAINIKDFTPVCKATSLENLLIASSCLTKCPDFTGLTGLKEFVFNGHYVSEKDLKAHVPAKFADDAEWLSVNGHIVEPVELSDEENGVFFEGDVIDNTSLSVELTKAYDSLFAEKLTLDSSAHIEVYDITLEHSLYDGSPDQFMAVQANGDSTIVFTDLPNGEYVIYRREADDSVTELKCQVKNGQLSFVTEHYSIFAVVRVKDAFPVWGFIGLGLVALGVLGGVFVFLKTKKKKAA